MNREPCFVPPEAAATALGLPADWLLDEARANRIPSIPVGAALFLPLEAVRQILQERAKPEGKRAREVRQAEPALLNAKGAATLLSISRGGFYSKVSCGQARSPVRIGTTPRWRRQEPRDWIKAGCPPLHR